MQQDERDLRSPKCPLCGYIALDECPHSECVIYEQQIQDEEDAYVARLIDEDAKEWGWL
ncbi:hypothetical protein LCGC14_1214250 [marine sediment metagenome]|uniref:Uncharacterized protein n=1 Tax=marine sediment metagenome TaxID=412755 RepID=A0A0F9LHB6_9ZZZZ